MNDVVDQRRIIRREVSIRAAGQDDAEIPTRLELTVATSDPVRVWGEDEVLSMHADAVDMSRLANNAPFLANHANDIWEILGRLEDPRLDGERLVASVKLADIKPARAYAQLVAQGMANKASVGFRVERWEQTREEGDGEVAEWTATRWTPFEASAVAVPADDGAGVDHHHRTIRRRTMADTVDTEKMETAKAAQPPRAQTEAEMATQVERQRVNELTDYGAEFGSVGGPELAATLVRNGGSLQDLKELISGEHEKRYREAVKANEEAGYPTGATGDGDIGLTRGEVVGFSFVRAARDLVALRTNSGHNSHELDIMRSANAAIRKANARVLGSDWSVPASILHHRVLAASTGAGANLVATDLDSMSFIDILRAESVVVPLATRVMDLVGDYDVPRQNGTVSENWRAENDAASSVGDQSYDQLELRPKDLIIGTTVTRRFLAQSTPDGEMLLRRDLAEVAGLAIDYAALFGAGGAQPQGVFGINGGAQGITATAANDKLSWGDPLALETKVAEGNALRGNLAYVSHPAVRGEGKNTVKGGDGSGRFVVEDNESNGFPFAISTKVPRTFDSATDAAGGDKDALFFGNWRDIVIGYWAGADYLVNPYSGQMRNYITISLHQMADVGVRHHESFAYVYDLDV